MKIIYSPLIILMLMLSCVSMAETWKTWDEVHPSLIKWVYPTDTTLVFYLVSKPKVNKTNCKGQMYIEVTDDNYQMKASGILAAYMAGKEVEVIWDKDADSESAACHAHVSRFIISDGATDI